MSEELFEIASHHDRGTEDRSEPMPEPLAERVKEVSGNAEPPLSVSREHLKSVVESMVFVADKPLTLQEMGRIAQSNAKELRPILEELIADYKGRGVELAEVAGGFQFRSIAANAPFVREIVGQKPVRLARAQLETLAIIGYRQPMTRPEIDDIRGVDCGGSLKVLLERGLIRILGRKEEPGRPLLYGTTPYFLEFFGLKRLNELPTLKEFSDLTEESRALFERKTGEPLVLEEEVDSESLDFGEHDAETFDLPS